MSLKPNSLDLIIITSYHSKACKYCLLYPPLFLHPEAPHLSLLFCCIWIFPPLFTASSFHLRERPCCSSGLIEKFIYTITIMELLCTFEKSNNVLFFSLPSPVEDTLLTNNSSYSKHPSMELVRKEKKKVK